MATNRLLLLLFVAQILGLLLTMAETSEQEHAKGTEHYLQKSRLDEDASVKPKFIAVERAAAQVCAFQVESQMRRPSLGFRYGTHR
jgi:hypothetical protein